MRNQRRQRRKPRVLEQKLAPRTSISRRRTEIRARHRSTNRAGMIFGEGGCQSQRNGAMNFPRRPSSMQIPKKKFCRQSGSGCVTNSCVIHGPSANWRLSLARCGYERGGAMRLTFTQEKLGSSCGLRSSAEHNDSVSTHCGAWSN